jgi:hypothetical protein
MTIIRIFLSDFGHFQRNEYLDATTTFLKAFKYEFAYLLGPTAQNLNEGDDLETGARVFLPECRNDAPLIRRPRRVVGVYWGPNNLFETT